MIAAFGTQRLLRILCLGFLGVLLSRPFQTQQRFEWTVAAFAFVTFMIVLAEIASVSHRRRLEAAMRKTEQQQAEWEECQRKWAEIQKRLNQP